MWGATFVVSKLVACRQYFNPRSPCGERPVTSRNARFVGVFQSTLPVWGATHQNPQLSDHPRFQSTLPVWGATTIRRLPPMTPVFQSTLPVWGATASSFASHCITRISIHAPRVGSDRANRDGLNVTIKFQSTLPVWGATPRQRRIKLLRHISIHAPRVGSD